MKRNLRSTTAIVNSRLFPTIYQHTRAWDRHYGQKCNLREIAHGTSLKLLITCQTLRLKCI